MTEPVLTSDPHAWIRPYYSSLVAQRGFALLAPSLQFQTLVESIEADFPTKAAEMRGWNDAAQRGFLGWIADVIAQRPPARETELWRLCKRDRELRCVAVYLPIGIDLRMMEDNEFRRTELLRDAPSVKARADEWSRHLTARGWS